jgi:hypothetical protein
VQEWANLPFLPAAYLLKPKADNGKKKKACGERTNPAGSNATRPAARAPRLQNTSHVTTALVARFTTWGQELNTVTSMAGITPAYADGSGPAAENQICLSYHLRKSCTAEGCCRAASHRQLTASEVTAVAQFMTDVGIP